MFSMSDDVCSSNLCKNTFARIRGLPEKCKRTVMTIVAQNVLVHLFTILHLSVIHFCFIFKNKQFLQICVIPYHIHTAKSSNSAYIYRMQNFQNFAAEYCIIWRRILKFWHRILERLHEKMVIKMMYPSKLQKF